MLLLFFYLGVPIYNIIIVLKTLFFWVCSATTRLQSSQSTVYSLRQYYYIGTASVFSKGYYNDYYYNISSAALGAITRTGLSIEPSGRRAPSILSLMNDNNQVDEYFGIHVGRYIYIYIYILYL